MILNMLAAAFVFFYSFKWSRGKYFNKTGWQGVVFFAFLVISFYAFFLTAISLAAIK